MPVLAYVYRATYTITETNGTSYDMLAVITDNDTNNQWMANNGFMNSSANDTQVETLGGLVKPHLVTDNATLTAVAVPANSQTNLYFTTGNTPSATPFKIITGYGGYITTDDNPTIIGGSDNFSMEWSGYFDTDNGTDKNILRKDDSIDVSISPTVSETITASIYDGAFPVVAATNGGITDPGDTSHTVNLPAGIASGNLLLAFFHADGTTTITFPAGWDSVFATQGASSNLVCYSRVADGGEGASITVTTSNAQEAAFATYRITGYGTIQAGTSATGTSANPNPPVVNYGTPVNNLFIAIEGNDDGTKTVSNYPSNYAGSQLTYTSGGATDGVVIGVATRNLRAASADPGTFTLSGSIAWIANTVAIQPSPTSVSATGVASGEKTITVSQSKSLDFGAGDTATALDSDAFSFTDGAGTDRPFSVLAWVNLDDLTSQYCVLKYAAGQTEWYFYFDGGDRLSIYAAHPNAVFSIERRTNPVAASYIGQWVRIGATYDGSETSAGMNVYINGVDSDTGNADILPYTGMTNGTANLLIAPNAGGGGMAAEVQIYSVVLTPAEVLADYQGTQKTTNIVASWHLDEGTGNSLADSSGNGHVATNSGGAWVETAPLRLSIDGVIRSVALPTTIPSNTNDIVSFENNVMPYTDYMTIDVGGVEVLRYQPNTMIIGTALPDRTGSSDGVITWGSNPAGVSVALGGIVSAAQPSPSILPDQPTQDILPTAEVSDWYIDPNLATLSTNPLRPFVTILSDTTTLTELQAWRLLGLALVLFITVAVAVRVRGHHIITGVASGAAVGGCVAMTIFPMWALVFIVGAVFAGIIAERSPSL